MGSDTNRALSRFSRARMVMRSKRYCGRQRQQQTQPSYRFSERPHNDLTINALFESTPKPETCAMRIDEPGREQYFSAQKGQNAEPLVQPQKGLILHR